MSETLRLATYLAGVSRQDLPAEVAARTRLHLLDGVAAMISGSTLEAGQRAIGYVRKGILYRGGNIVKINLEGEANVLIMPNLDAANVAYQMIKVLADAVPVGPILIGAARPAHILTPSVTARGILNMTAVAAVEAQERAGRAQPTLFA